MAQIREFRKGVRVQVSKNFWSTEFDCKCTREDCKVTLIDLDHVAKLQELRDWADDSVDMSSAFRCEHHNKAVGGATKSRHKKGDASDVNVKGKTPDEVADKAEEIGFDGIGRYNSFTHLDSRGYTARWDFRRKK